MIWAWLNARRVLGTALALNIMSRLLRPRHRRQLPKRWLRQMANEGLTPTPVKAWPSGSQSDACTGCGQCEIDLPQGIRPSVWLQQMARSPADASLSMSHVAALKPFVGVIERACPAKVDVTAVLDRVTAQAESLALPSA